MPSILSVRLHSLSAILCNLHQDLAWYALPSLNVCNWDTICLGMHRLNSNLPEPLCLGIPNFVWSSIFCTRQACFWVSDPGASSLRYCIKLVLGPFILCACSQVLLRNLLAGRESERWWDISCDCVSPYYQRYIFFWKKLGLSAVVVLESGCCYCLFCQSRY